MGTYGQARGKRPGHAGAQEGRREDGRLPLVCGGLLLFGALALAVLGILLGPRRVALAYLSPAGELLSAAEPSPAPTRQPARTLPPVRMTAETTGAAAVEALGFVRPEEPKILIYHTHATEAYLATGKADAYEESGRWRTKDPERSVVAIGERLKEVLTERGFSVLHDITNHEPPKLSTAYSRSVETMERYRADYPGITVFIDVHRDAYGTKTDAPKDYLVIDGVETARLMFVVGTGEGATGAGFDEMPDFQSNLALAQAATDRLNGMYEGLAREVRVKTGRYNQHVSSSCMLVEVGHNANTLAQAMTAAGYLGEALAETLKGLDPAEAPETMAVWAPMAPS